MGFVTWLCAVCRVESKLKGRDFTPSEELTVEDQVTTHTHTPSHTHIHVCRWRLWCARPRRT